MFAKSKNRKVSHIYSFDAFAVETCRNNMMLFGIIKPSIFHTSHNQVSIFMAPFGIDIKTFFEIIRSIT